MILTQKATKIGGGLWIYLPQKVIEEFKIKGGDMIDLKITRNLNLEYDFEYESFAYRCRKCGHFFDSENKEDLFCTACGCEDLIKLKEESKDE